MNATSLCTKNADHNINCRPGKIVKAQKPRLIAKFSFGTRTRRNERYCNSRLESGAQRKKRVSRGLCISSKWGQNKIGTALWAQGNQCRSKSSVVSPRNRFSMKQSVPVLVVKDLFCATVLSEFSPHGRELCIRVGMLHSMTLFNAVSKTESQLYKKSKAMSLCFVTATGRFKYLFETK